MSPKVYQILHRSQEVETHNRVIKEITDSLTDDEKAELARETDARSKSAAPKPAAKPLGSGA